MDQSIPTNITYFKLETSVNGKTNMQLTIYFEGMQLTMLPGAAKTIIILSYDTGNIKFRLHVSAISPVIHIQRTRNDVEPYVGGGC
jgi:hypothetical protein